MIEFQPEKFQLIGQQKTLFDELLSKNRPLANMYYGALKVLADRDNLDQLALAAHGIRELMEKLPRYLDAPIKTKKSRKLNNELQNLAESWRSVLQQFETS